jgi:hypothetical protein
VSIKVTRKLSPWATVWLLALMTILSCGGGETIVYGPAQIQLIGTLSGERSQSSECLWLTEPNGVRWHLVPPPTWTVKFSPTRLFDPEGSLVAREGDLIRAEGPSAVGESTCSSEPPFPAETIDRIQEQPS